MRVFFRSLYMLLLVACMGGIAFFFWNVETSLPGLPYNDFVRFLDQGEVAKVHLRGDKDVVVTDTYGRQFALSLPNVSAVMPALVEKGIPVTTESEPSPFIINFASVTLPLLLLLIFGFYVHRKMAAADSNESEFVKKKASSAKVSAGRRVTFRDVAGVPEVKEEPA